ncbi:hypothetical protein PMIN02_006484 [Paraphaeosphaeria minitans]
MAFTSCTNACALLKASEREEQDNLPTPRQVSVLLRVINAEMMVQWDLATVKMMNVFWHRGKEAGTVKRSSLILNTGVLILLVSIIAAWFFLVQVVNIYFHIAAEAVQLFQVQEAPPVHR